MAEDEVDPTFLVFTLLSLSPKLIVKKQVVEPKKDETTEEYRERCRDLLAKMCGFKKYETNFNDFLDYQKRMKEAHE